MTIETKSLEHTYPNGKYFHVDNEGNRQLDLNNEMIKDVATYADSWDDFVVKPNPENKVTMENSSVKINKKSGEVYLPHPFIAPTTERTTKKEAQWVRAFYWDALFMIKALIAKGDEKSTELAKGHIDNFQYLFKEFTFIPNFADIISLNRSQPPFLTSMMFHIYEKTQEKKWLKEKIEFAKEEYQMVWMKTKEESIKNHERYPNHRIHPDTILSNFSGRDVPGDDYSAVAESGFDRTHQYMNRTSSFIPIMLNACLLHYEQDFAKAAKLFGNEEEEQQWIEAVARRKKEMNMYMWDDEKGYFFDYDARTGKKDSEYFALSGFMALWSGLASPEQAKRMIEEHLADFETLHGLTITPPDALLPVEEIQQYVDVLKKSGMRDRYEPAIRDLFAQGQWDYPNVWPPMQLLVLEGLLKYGYKKEAKRIMENLLVTLGKYYKDHKTLPEKINGKTGGSGGTFLYPDQEGFGWTKALVAFIYRELEKMNTQEMPLPEHHEDTGFIEGRMV